MNDKEANAHAANILIVAGIIYNDPPSHDHQGRKYSDWTCDRCIRAASKQYLYELDIDPASDARIRSKARQHAREVDKESLANDRGYDLIKRGISEQRITTTNEKE